MTRTFHYTALQSEQWQFLLPSVSTGVSVCVCKCMCICILKVYIEVWVLSGDLSVWFLKSCIDVCAQKPLVYTFILSVARLLPWTHACSEAQYYLLKEMTETFPRVKRQKKKKKKKLGILYGFQAWYTLESFSLVKPVLERHRCKVVLAAARVVPVHGIRPAGPARFLTGCGEASVTVHGGHLAHNLNYVECQHLSIYL